MKKILLTMCSVILGLTCCQDGDKIYIEGNITGATDSMLYFEQVGITEITTLDSMKLSDEGAFTFTCAKTEAPEFYRLRIHNQIINICADSIQNIKVTADYGNNMATNYSIEGCEDCKKIKELTTMQIRLQQQVMNTTDDDTIQSLLHQYKEKVKREYIFAAPSRAYSYFALFQTIGRYLIFDPSTNKDDIKAFAAVATSWDTYFPGSERSENLHNIAIDGMNNTRYLEARMKNAIDISNAEETGVIDIALPDNNGNIRHLTDLKGKVVLLYFNIFNTDQSMERIMQVRELYEKYQQRGLEVFMVSLDDNEHFWKTSTKRLPWINVRDEAGEYSQLIGLYNVQGIPSFYLINRANQLVSRDAQIKDLEKSILELL